MSEQSYRYGANQNNHPTYKTTLNGQEMGRIPEKSRVKWELTPDREHFRFDNLGHEALVACEGNPENALANLIDKFDYLGSKFSESFKRHNQLEMAVFGSSAIKCVAEVMKVSQSIPHEKKMELMKDLIRRSDFHFGLEGKLPTESKARLAGAMSEYALAKILSQDCFIDCFLSTIQEDTNKDKVDIWATPGSSDYEGFAMAPDQVWAIQVKSGTNSRAIIMPINTITDLQTQLLLDYKIPPNTAERYAIAADSLIQTSQKYTNVTPVLAIMPDYWSSTGLYDQQTGEPNQTFSGQIDDDLSKLSDVKLNKSKTKTLMVAA